MPLLGSPRRAPRARAHAARRPRHRRVLARVPERDRRGRPRARASSTSRSTSCPGSSTCSAPKVAVHTIEALPLVGLPPVRLSRSSRFVKRLIDVVGASTVLLVLTAPLFVAARARDPLRLAGAGLLPADPARAAGCASSRCSSSARCAWTPTIGRPSRRTSAQTMTAGRDRGRERHVQARPGRRGDPRRPLAAARRASTSCRSCSTCSRGDMSLVGPRPCLRYETELFRPHHFERFLVPPGITGLWQVSGARHARRSARRSTWTSPTRAAGRSGSISGCCSGRRCRCCDREEPPDAPLDRWARRTTHAVRTPSSASATGGRTSSATSTSTRRPRSSRSATRARTPLDEDRARATRASGTTTELDDDPRRRRASRPSRSRRRSRPIHAGAGARSRPASTSSSRSRSRRSAAEARGADRAGRGKPASC